VLMLLGSDKLNAPLVQPPNQLLPRHAGPLGAISPPHTSWSFVIQASQSVVPGFSSVWRLSCPATGSHARLPSTSNSPQAQPPANAHTVTCIALSRFLPALGVWSDASSCVKQRGAKADLQTFPRLLHQSLYVSVTVFMRFIRNRPHPGSVIIPTGLS
jgi:hypothetical protein